MTDTDFLHAMTKMPDFAHMFRFTAWVRNVVSSNYCRCGNVVVPDDNRLRQSIVLIKLWITSTRTCLLSNLIIECKLGGDLRWNTNDNAVVVTWWELIHNLSTFINVLHYIFNAFDRLCGVKFCDTHFANSSEYLEPSPCWRVLWMINCSIIASRLLLLH